MKPLTLPKCGTCDLMVPAGPGPDDSLWCHGAPPTAYRVPVVVMVEGQPKHEERLSSAYPPVGRDNPGCAMHPLLRKKLGRA